MANAFAAGANVLLRHLRYARTDLRKLGWVVTRAARILLRGELRGVLARHARESELNAAYPAWIAGNTPDAVGLGAQLAALQRRPRIAIVMPVFQPVADYLRTAIASVEEQVYPHWELFIVDDGTARPAIDVLLDDCAAREPRIRVIRFADNRGIVAASNAGIAQASADYVGLLDQDDALAPHALLRFAQAIDAHPDVRYLYSDEDRIDEQGRRQRPVFKSGWNPELLRTTNSVLHCVLVERTLLQRLGGLRVGMDGVQDWDLALRVAEVVPEAQIRHLPEVLYHWRVHKGSTAAGPYEKKWLLEKQREVILDSLVRRHESAQVDALIGGWRIRFAVGVPAPRVTLIVISRGNGRHDVLARCLESIVSRTSYSAYDVLVTATTADESALGYVRQLAPCQRFAWLHVAGEPSFGTLINGGVEAADARHVVLLRDDVAVRERDWLHELMGHAARRDVGLVGATLYDRRNGLIQAGLIVGMNGVTGRAHPGAPRGYRGIDGNAGYVQEIGAVSTEAAALRRDVFLEAGGMDASLSGDVRDVDFCLKLRALGYRILWTPHAMLEVGDAPHDGIAFTTPEQQQTLRARWARELLDPYYNPNFALTGDPFRLRADTRTVSASAARPMPR